jgi:hypothetical protein
VFAVVVFSSLSFNDTGELLAAGDKRGNVVILQQQDAEASSPVNVVCLFVVVVFNELNKQQCAAS